MCSPSPRRSWAACEASLRSETPACYLPEDFISMKFANLELHTIIVTYLTLFLLTPRRAMTTGTSSNHNCNVEFSRAVTNLAFDNAYKSFYKSLPEKDQVLFAPCASAEDLTKGLEKLSCLAKLRQKRSGFLSRIAEFAKALQPYLNIVDILVSSNPQYTALVWGSLRLILQVNVQGRETRKRPSNGS